MSSMDEDYTQQTTSHFVPGECLISIGDRDQGFTRLRSPSGRIHLSSVRRLSERMAALNDRFGVTIIEGVFQHTGVRPQRRLRGVRSSFDFDIPNWYRLILSKELDVQEVVAEYAQLPLVTSGQPNWIYRLFRIVPDDLLYHKQWAHQVICSELGWRSTTGESSIIIAVIDTGVDTNHPDLRQNLSPGFNFVNMTDGVADDNGHGTHCSGIIGAIGNNRIGITGVCWRCTILPVKAFDRHGRSTSVNTARAIRYAADQGARIINLSFGIYVKDRLEEAAIKYAYAKGCCLVAATGNDGVSTPGYPAAFKEVIAVGATNVDDSVCIFSNRGEYVDVVAPGASVLSTTPLQQVPINEDGVPRMYGAMDGTSMAAPHVAGVIGLMLSKLPELQPNQVRQSIRDSADKLGATPFDPHYGYGRINLANALARCE